MGNLIIGRPKSVCDIRPLEPISEHTKLMVNIAKLTKKMVCEAQKALSKEKNIVFYYEGSVYSTDGVEVFE